ncbi:MAG: radical SAM protein [Planctomycetes bacterium]|nr:radical SAM protein [Planctomycetota bacterium]
MPPTTRFPLPATATHVWVAHLTARCNFACDYCIQKPQVIPGQPRRPWGRYRELDGRQWVEALNAFPVRPERALILTGGEPSLHRDFAFIAARLEGYDLDLTSNLTFDVDAVAAEMRAHGKTFRTSFHTYHPQFIGPETWLDQAERLRDSGLVEAPVFSLVGLGRFPHFRSDAHDRNVKKLIELARRRGLTLQCNEFRGPHLGHAFDRERRTRIDCTSAWVNIDPEGGIYNCQYHLTERSNRFGNITAIEHCRPLPEMGQFFACDDFGFCDPCHENSGHGAFRDRDGRIFGRTGDDPDIYLRLMQPAAIREVARRYLAQGNAEAAEHALLAAIGKERTAGADSSGTWAQLAAALYDTGRKKHSLAATVRAIEGGAATTETVAAAISVARELDLVPLARATILRSMPSAPLRRIEQALDAANTPATSTD